MTKRLATIAAGAAVLGVVGLMAPTAAVAATTPSAVKPAITCETHQEDSGATRSSYYGNCTDHGVKIEVWFIVIPVGSDLPYETDEGSQCVPAQTDYLMGTVTTTDYWFAAYTGTDSGTC